MSRTKKEFKYFTIAQYEQEQDYLSEMHRNGWKLVKITYPGFYFFEECEPEDVVYQLDFNAEGIADKTEYIQIFEDGGWEHLFEFVGYSYFRKKREGEQEDDSIFTDMASRVDMMKRVFKGRIFPLLAFFAGIIVPQLALNLNRNDGRLSPLIVILYFVVFYIYVFAFSVFGYQFYQYELKVLERPEQMNKIKARYFAIFSALIIASIVAGWCGYRYLNRESEYQYVERQDGFMITGEYFDDCIMKQYELEAGDEIWVSTDRSNGIFDIRIGREGVEPIFTGNGTLAEAFSLTVPEAGIYTISCEGRGIEGSIDFQIK